MAKIHVVIPVWNGWDQTRICLDSLRKSTHRDLEVIVVDHGSTDETKQALPTEYPEVVHVLGDEKLWWTGASNLGIRTAIKRGAETIMLLNHDCYVDVEAIRLLVEHLEQIGPAVIAPIQRDFVTKRLLFITASTCYTFGFPTLILPRTAPLDPSRLLSTKLIVGGRGVLIPVKVFTRIGLLDELHLPHSGSDNDFYLRCRRHGIPLWVAPDATVYVDNTRTSLAADAEKFGFRRFWQTLSDRRSHRNIHDLSALFRLHYPIRRLYLLGVALNVCRYFLVFACRRFLYLRRKSPPSINLLLR